MPSLDWIGKRAVLNHHRQVPYHLLRCDKDLSVGDAGSGNLLVRGDNLVALKAILPYYAGKVKCIYIDPPYNTGNEGWTYNDAVNSPEMRNWLGVAVKGEEDDLTRHDKWLCMMYPRLQLLRQFLREDGLIFVSVDENEHHHLALMLEEVFGKANRLETIVWKKSYGGGSKAKHIVNLHEYIEVFANRIDKIDKLELPPDERAHKYYKFTDEKFEARGPYRLQPLATTSMDERPNLRYPISHGGEEIWPEKQWQWSRERVMTALEENELLIAKRKGKWTVSYKQYLKDSEGLERASKPYSILEGIYTQQGTNELKAMFGDGKTFSFPKPRGLIQHLLRFGTDRDSLILDSFAGSGTTGHAVLALNQMDGGDRRFILVEMDAHICEEVTAQRLRKAIEGYGDEPPLPGGFRYCQLGPPLFSETGSIRADLSFAELAAHIYFTETGEPIPNPVTRRTPLIGQHNGTAYCLLFNGVLGDKRLHGGNVLTGQTLAMLPRHDGPRIVYGEGCRLGIARLKREHIVFKQLPYEIKVA